QEIERQREKTVAGIESAVVRSPHVSWCWCWCWCWPLVPPIVERRREAQSGSRHGCADARFARMFLRGGLGLFKLTNEGPIGRLTGDGGTKSCR
ncbi:uncharacterized protein CCOS01_05814, partial [Colletotrichum costaricense]